MAKFVQNNLVFRNNQSIIMGNSSQAEMLFNGSNLVLSTSAGDLSLESAPGNSINSPNEIFADRIESRTGINDISAISGQGGSFISHRLTDVLSTNRGQSCGFVIFKGKMWQYGGGNFGDPSEAVKRIYSSTDGIEWVMEGYLPIAWALGGIVVFKGRVWLFGGIDYDLLSTITSVYMSDENGLNFTKVGDLPVSAYGFRATVHNGKMWVAGGQTLGGYDGKIYGSSDGINWSQNNMPAARSYGVFVTFRNKLWYVAGYDDAVDGQDDVWSSTDGENWDVEANFPRATSTDGVVYDDKIVTIGGLTTGGGTQYPDVVYTSDGTTWTIVTNAIGENVYACNPVVYKGKIFFSFADNENSLVVLNPSINYGFSVDIPQGAGVAPTSIFKVDENGITVNGNIISDSTTDITIAGDIYCNDLHTAGSSIYLGTILLTDNAGTLTSSSGVSIPNGALAVGEDDVEDGQIRVYGDSNKSQGRIYIYNGAGQDTTVDYYQIGGSGGGTFLIGPNTQVGSITYTESSSKWSFASSGGLAAITGLEVGSEDNTQGIIDVYGGGNSEAGGEMRIYTPADYDGTIDYYSINVPTGSADLNIGPVTDPDALMYDSGNNLWHFKAAGGVTIGNGSEYGSTAVLNLGADDTEHGILHVRSDPVAGGEIYIYTGGYYDTTIDYYLFSTADDDIRFGPSTNTAAQYYDAGNNQWNFTASAGMIIRNPGALYIGVDDNDPGTIVLYGGGNGEAGGEVRVYLPADQDGTIDYYSMNVPTGTDDLYIGPVTDPDALKYDANEGWFQFTRPTTSFGTEDSVGSIVNFFGRGAGQVVGGEIRVHPAADHDSPIVYYRIRAYEDDLSIGPSSDQFSLKYDGGDGTWNFTGASGVQISNDLTVGGNLYVDGTTFVVHNQQVTTSDNLITINYGEAGAGVTAGSAGIEVDRGSLTNYQFLFVEASDTFRIGEIGDLQAVATREDSPVDGRFAYWNDSEKRFDTVNSVLSVDATGLIVAGDIYCNDLHTAGSSLFVGDAQITATGTTINISDLNVTTSASIVMTGGSIDNVTIGAGTPVDITMNSGYIGGTTLSDGSISDDGQLVVNGATGLEFQYDTLPVASVGNGIFTVTGYGIFNVGSEDTQRAQVRLYNADGEEASLLFDTPPNYDDTITGYSFRCGWNSSADFIIGPSNYVHSLRYDSTTPTWQFSEGNLTIGWETGIGDTRGLLKLLGGDTNEGGEIQFFVGGLDSTAVEKYLMKTVDENFEIGPVTDPDALKYDGTTNTWEMSASGGSQDIIPVTVQQNTQGISGVLTIDSTTGYWIDADYNSEDTVGMLAMAKESGTGAKKVILRGIVTNGAWSWTPNDQLYVGTNGQIVNTPPDVEGDFIQVVGYALSATTIYFNPSPNYAEVGP